MDSNLGMIIQADLITRYVLVTGVKFIHRARIKVPVKNQNLNNSRFPICADVALREASTLKNHIFCTHQMSPRYQK